MSGHKVISDHETPSLSTYYMYGKVSANSIRVIHDEFHKFIYDI